MIPHHTVSNSRKNRLNNWTIFVSLFSLKIKSSGKKTKKLFQFFLQKQNVKKGERKNWIWHRVLSACLTHVANLTQQRQRKESQIGKWKEANNSEEFYFLSLKHKKPNSKVGCWSVYQRKQPKQNLSLSLTQSCRQKYFFFAFVKHLRPGRKLKNGQKMNNESERSTNR